MITNDNIDEITKELNDKYKINFKCEKSEGRWHTELSLVYKINDKHCSYRIVTNPSGCGSMLMHGYYGILYGYSNADKKENEIHKAVFNKVMDLSYDNQVGVIITTLGETFYDRDLLKKLGFETVYEYPNPRHGDDYSQRLMIYNLRKGD